MMSTADVDNKVQPVKISLLSRWIRIISNKRRINEVIILNNIIIDI